MRLIDANALLKASRRGKVLYFDDTTTDGYTDVILAVEVERAPTIDAEPVRHGEWIDIEPIYNYECHQSAHYKCSECGRRTGYKQTRSYNFCPKCGAKMDGCNA